MPELPEVLTTIKQLKSQVLNQAIKTVWLDHKTKFDNFTKTSFTNGIQNKKIIDITNIGKYILIHLSNDNTLIIHQKISGHLLYGKFIKTNNTWKNQDKNSLLNDPTNRFIHLALTLTNKNSIVLSDSRRLSRITLISTKDILTIKPLQQMGINPLSKAWTFSSFKQKLLTHNVAIKKALLMQNIISGLGNIYSDEVLFKSKVRPTRLIATLTDQELKAIFKHIPLILKKAITLRGTTFATYRNPDGNPGSFLKFLNVYGRKNLPCKICKNKLKSIKINNRSACYCEHCQK